MAGAMTVFVFHIKIVIWGHEAIERSGKPVLQKTKPISVNAKPVWELQTKPFSDIPKPVLSLQPKPVWLKPVSRKPASARLKRNRPKPNLTGATVS